jgi:hypothetical protein
MEEVITKSYCGIFAQSKNCRSKETVVASLERERERGGDAIWKVCA